ncbi:MAG TPA: ATP-binding protein [Pyrinomonadaceae bacterium]|nr:ATP-binding protein [Pyrinomonadaceae bacterium]
MSDNERKNSDSGDDVEATGFVYRKVASANTQLSATPPPKGSIWSRELSPALLPLLVGFLLLLIFIFTVGYISATQTENVRLAVLDLEQQHAAKLSMLLKLRLAVTQLNNEARKRDEARARAETDTRLELKPPFEIRLNSARSDLRQLIREANRPSLMSDPGWRQLGNDLQTYLAVTEDPRRYSLEGFDKFDAVDKEIDALLNQSTEAQDEVFRQSDAIQRQAGRSIRNWTIVALLFGALVAAGTIWEIQRRFGEMRRSVDLSKRERAFTSQLLQGMVSAVVAVDENDRIRSANAAFFKIFPRATIGASLYEKFASDAALKMLEAAAATRTDQASYRGRWVCPAGEDCDKEQTFDVYSSPLEIDAARGQILTLVDVTEAAEAERGLRRQESLAAVGQATAQVAHEIRNPLGSIRLGVSMLRDSVTDKEGLNTIELVERGIKHLNKLVVDVAQFSRRKALEQQNVDLHQLINHSLDLVADKIREKETPVEKTLSPETMIGHWDPDQLNQVFVNIIANAIDASPKRAAVSIITEAVYVDSTADDPLTKKARVTITDHGSGMDRSTIDRIFEPFFSTKKRGTGLGLAIVKQIVEQHDGTISLESEPGKGTKFVIDLPL